MIGQYPGAAGVGKMTRAAPLPGTIGICERCMTAK
jgi:hypothetical protein